MSDNTPNMNDPLSFVRNMWSNMGITMPGMVTPTFDVDELDKRITDMKAVEGWLRMNLSMLQMTIQGLEMQRTTLTAVQAMGQMASDSARSMAPAAAEEPAAPVDAEKSTLSEAAMWPWQMMQQMREKMQEGAEAVQAAASEKKSAAKKSAARRSSK
jgi:hypothetical protein